MNEQRAAAAVRELLEALDYDPDSEALRDTPARVARAWRELTEGRRGDPVKVLGTTFSAERYDEIILLRDVPFYSTCEHHLLPFHGRAHVAYVPGEDGRIVGLSKLARLVEMHARRLQIQERMTSGIAADLETVLRPRGVGVIVRAQHMCMCARGISKAGSEMVTSVMRGCFMDRPEARAELLVLAR